MAISINTSATTHYVDVNSVVPVPPYTNSLTAAKNIQDAIDAAAEPGAQVLVSNGIYVTGWRAVSGATNRLVIHSYLTLQSVNGPTYTTIDGGHAVRCVYLAGSSIISGFTLMNGYVSEYNFGGGVFCESSSCLISNCVLTGSSAAYDAYLPGVAYTLTPRNEVPGYQRKIRGPVTITRTR